MSWNAAMHIAGWVCLLTILGIALFAMFEVVGPQWRRILRLAAGNIEPAFAPVPTGCAVSRERAA
jgi:hypothetical protein